MKFSSILRLLIFITIPPIFMLNAANQRNDLNEPYELGVVTGMKLHGEEINDATIERLLPHKKTMLDFSLNYTSITSDCLVNLAQFTYLRSLDLRGNKHITNDVTTICDLITLLENLKNLNYIFLDHYPTYYKNPKKLYTLLLSTMLSR